VSKTNLRDWRQCHTRCCRHCTMLRYRGKFYDSATGLYYLQSRFYDPVIGRFINADAFLSTGQGLLGYNPFVYCLNNPVMFVDPDGYMARPGNNLHACIPRPGNNLHSNITPRAFRPGNNLHSNITFHNVPVLHQNRTMLCWAYSQVSARYAGFRITQEYGSLQVRVIARSVHGENYDRPGWPTNMGSRVWGVGNFDTLYRELQNGPLYAFYRHRIPWRVGHIVVVSGACSTTRRIHSTDSARGISGWQTHQNFLLAYIGANPNGNRPLHSVHRVNSGGGWY